MATVDKNKMYYCEKCNKTMRADQFYTSNNLEKYPEEGKLHQCKKCLTMHVDNWNPETYLWILQELDVPYVPEEWNKALAKWGQDPSKVTGITILGRYLSVMKLKQYKDYRWEHTDFLQEVANKKIKDAMSRQGYDAAQIAEAIDKASFPIPEGPLAQPVYESDEQDSQAYETGNLYQPFAQDIENELISDLTDEDKRMLCIKWGKTYRPDEWIKLEQLYQEMMESYDIQTAGDKNTLILACKSSLKANQLMDIGDIDGAQKATKMYDSLMKSGKWTAAQNKADGTELFDSIGEIVAMCERDGFIPRYYVTGPQDHADRIIQDMEKYTSDLITNETGLTTLMENALKQIEEENERIKAAAEMGEALEDEEDKMFSYDNDKLITDEDISEFKDFQLSNTEHDQDVIQQLLEEN